MTRSAHALQALAFTAFACLAAGMVFADPVSATTARRHPDGAIRYYDDRGQFRGYAWCLILTGRQDGGQLDCSYYTLEQCRLSGFGGAHSHAGCQPNPFASAAAPPPASRRR